MSNSRDMCKFSLLGVSWVFYANLFETNLSPRFRDSYFTICVKQYPVKTIQLLEYPAIF